MIDFNQKFNEYLTKFNEYLSNVFSTLPDNSPKIIREAMSYAVSGGGKRVRPVLCFALAEMFGKSFDDVKELALAIEIIHSYSLVHDDLPAMDNDDYRRGKLSTHKKFGEAYGILAGDALLNYAFELVLSKENFTALHGKALYEIARCSGFSGMIGGQVLDLQNEKNDVNEQTLFEIISKKTSALIQAPLLSVSVLCGKKYYAELLEFGLRLGYLFQITDDLLDEEGSLSSLGKTPHKDKAEDKLTAVKLYGLAGAKKKAEEQYVICKEILSKIDNSEFLTCFTDKIYLRKN